jgi:hypothetical protein
MIRRSFWFALSAAAAAVIGLELAAGTAPMSGFAATVPAPPFTASPPPAVTADGGTLSRDILARPLFAATRRPPPPALAPAAPAVSAPAPPPAARLAGTVTAGTERVAFFDDPPGKPLTLGIGGMLQGWHVTAIAPGRVTLSAADGRQVVKTLSGAAAMPVGGFPVVATAIRYWHAPAMRHED